MEKSKQFVNHLIGGTKDGSITWKTRGDLFDAETLVSRNGIRLPVTLTFEKNLVHVYLASEGHVYLPNVERESSQLCVMVKDKLKTEQEKWIEEGCKILGDFLK